MEESSPCSWARERVRKTDPVFMDHQMILSPPSYLEHLDLEPFPCIALHFILIFISRSITYAHLFLLLLFHMFANMHFTLNSPASLFNYSVLSCIFCYSFFILNAIVNSFLSFSYLNPFAIISVHLHRNEEE